MERSKPSRKNKQKKGKEAGAKGSITVKCDNGRTTTYTFGGDKKANTLDGGSPHPYTGGGFDSSQVKPEKVDDTNRVVPKITADGHGDVVARSGPDGTDDTGRFYGGIMGDRTKVYPDSGGARPIDPVRIQADETAS